jgi:hypothetical protein
MTIEREIERKAASEQTTPDLVNLFYWSARRSVGSEEIVKELLTRPDFQVEAKKYLRSLHDEADKFRDDLNAAVNEFKVVQ